MRTWVSADLEVREPMSLGGTFAPVGLLISHAWNLHAWANLLQGSLVRLWLGIAPRRLEGACAEQRRMPPLGCP